MKKFFLVILLFVPFAVSAAPSVRVLGTKNIGTSQVVPAKIDGAKKVTTNARVGTLRNKASSSGTSGVLTSNGSRFPVISPAKSYNIVTQPSTGSAGYNPSNAGTSGSGSCNMCTDTIDEIVDNVTEKVEGDILNNYYDKTETYNTSEVYNKTEVYNNNEFKEAVKDVDDPRIDAIRTRNPANLHPGVQLPSDYIYVWIEQ